MILEREKMEKMWESGAKMSELYWGLWKVAAESSKLWKEKSHSMMKNYMKTSKEMLDEQMKWFDAVLMQASKGQQQMYTVTKEIVMSSVENMRNASFNPWLSFMQMMNSNDINEGEKTN
ncbi:hypothetical protein [Thermosyntropha sp.]|uniref:hypothetical protein n=1 Tax=Thermosyntropha sp. TaxID=2740820 RepID=UPI0025DCEF3F|nr:hypothetical protein [Thermosyntropha sp.]MBO8158154.1 hypothetical protein [Thermosyntropha sp.]